MCKKLYSRVNKIRIFALNKFVQSSGPYAYFPPPDGLCFLIFFWKMRKKQKDPVNLVNPVQKELK